MSKARCYTKQWDTIQATEHLCKFSEDYSTIMGQYSELNKPFHRMLVRLDKTPLLPSGYVEERKTRIEEMEDKIKASLKTLETLCGFWKTQVRGMFGCRESAWLPPSFASDEFGHGTVAVDEFGRGGTVAVHRLKKEIYEMIEQRKRAGNGAAFIAEISDSDELDHGAASNYEPLLVSSDDEFASDDEPIKRASASSEEQRHLGCLI